MFSSICELIDSVTHRMSWDPGRTMYSFLDYNNKVMTITRGKELFFFWPWEAIRQTSYIHCYFWSVCTSKIYQKWNKNMHTCAQKGLKFMLKTFQNFKERLPLWRGGLCPHLQFVYFRVTVQVSAIALPIWFPANEFSICGFTFQTLIITGAWWIQS